MLVIVTGSSGLIGSNLSKLLVSKKINVIGIDIMKSTINNDNYKHLEIDLRRYKDINILSEQINKYNMDKSNIHFCHLAAKISVKESMLDPYNYYMSNTLSTLNILEYMRLNNYSNFYFSSTAAVYNSSGDTNSMLLETDNLDPVSVYGKTKLLSEELILDYSKNYSISAYIFRFFNVAGGRDTEYPPHHLIPILIDSVNKNKTWKVFGNDYPTSDKSCIRDYIHVDDVVNAFYLSIQNKINGIEIINLGSGIGHSVYEIMNITKNILQNIHNNKNNISIEEKERRGGDPPYLVANINKSKKILDWIPTKSINTIVLDTILSYK